jgi:RNA polymerase sigma factor (sigma-70 family)
LAGSWWHVLRTGEKQERVDRVGLTAADLVGARCRESAAVTRIYTAYAPFVFRFFLAAVGDRPTAEDLTGDVFKSAIEGLPRFGGPVEALGGWLFRIAHHDLTDFRRKQARSARITSLDDTLDDAVLAAGTDDPEALAIERIEGDRVLAALRQLSTEQREVLLLCVAAGLTAPEVAAIVGKSSGAVKALRRRGLAALARVLGITNGTSSSVPPSRSPEPARLTGQVEQG